MVGGGRREAGREGRFRRRGSTENRDVDQSQLPNPTKS